VTQKFFAQSNYSIDPLSINSPHSNEIHAIAYENGIIFYSDRRTQVLVSRVDTVNNPLFHFFVANIQNDPVKFGNPHSLSHNIPIKAHQVSSSISADGRELFFAANDENGQRIYSARRSGNNWSNIQPFTHSRANIIATHPSLSPDGTRLFFASDMPGGYGGFDIYVSERTNRGWGPPVNLGPEINTAENELFPFIQANGELFFSSTAHGSMGGLDIFTAREINGEWGFVQRLEEPINSTADDISYTAANPDGTTGYFASNRDGKTFNLYAFNSLFPAFSFCREQEENDYTYFISDPGVMPDSVAATLRYEWEMGDGTTRYGDEVELTYATSGEYEILLSIRDTLTGEYRRHVERYMLYVEEIEQPYITISSPPKAGAPVTFDATKTYLPGINIDDYYWILGDGTRKTGIRTTHTYTRPGVYRVQLGVIGKSKYFEGEERVCTFLEVVVE